MSDILDEAQGIAQCKDCPWYRNCVSPVKLTAEDIRKQLEASTSGMNQSGQVDPAMQSLLFGMATAAQNSMLEGCPVFISRLRRGSELAQRLKEIMQQWGKEELS